MRKLAIVGMKHSGSTMIYNLLKHVLEKKNIPHILHKSHKFLNFDPDVDIICTFRDIRDVSISGFYRFIYNQSLHNNKKINAQEEIHKFGLYTFLERMHDSISYYNIWKSSGKVKLFIRYEDFKTDLKNQIQFVLEQLDFKNIDLDFVNECLQHIEEFPKQNHLAMDLHDYFNRTFKQNDETIPLLTKDHNTSNGKIGKYKDFFKKYQLKIIYKDPIVFDFLTSHNYPL